ncbi:MAG TPA: cell envelope integrity protein TolA [Steroidobacteraceae bacterium]|jgi:colicin import membrane protein|nr:cell envelope integrity protein TolA [Steroidobacteraceae bacterium]
MPERAPQDNPQRQRPGRIERGSDRLVSILLSVLVHGIIVGALVWGYWRYRNPPTPSQTLAIDAHVVRDNPRLRSETPPVQTPIDQTRVEQQREAAQAKAAAAAAALAQQQAAAKAAAQKAADAKAAAQAATQQAAAHAEAEKAAAAKAVQEQAEKEQAQQAAAQKLAAEKAAAQKAAEAKVAAERKAKQEAEAKAKAEAAREAQQLAQQLKTEQAERATAADLKNQLQKEERLDALEHGPAEEEYVTAIIARISQFWVRPASAQPGVKCTVHLTQISGGEVTRVTVEDCNGDEAVRQSVQTAVYRASPLPAPPDPALFQPNIIVTFAPDQ